MTRHAAEGRRDDPARLALSLIKGSLDSLLGRDGFRAALALAPPAPPPDAALSAASFARCTPIGKTMPAASERVLDATVLVRNREGHGSGFFLTPDGLVLTAAHVVRDPSVKLRLHGGLEVEAIMIRMSRASDVALLRPVRPLTGQPCLSPVASPTASGGEVYAAGAPADEKLAFSLSRGIVSGIRQIDGHRKLQTDTALSPGNSGGPLVDVNGEAVAVVTSKLVSRKVEGVGFGVPIDEVLKALALSPAAATDTTLLTSVGLVPDSPPPVRPSTDTPDPVPSLDPGADRDQDEADSAQVLREADARRHAERSRMTPVYVPVMILGGLGLTAAGVVGVIVTYSGHSDDSTSGNDASFRRNSYLSWGATVVGLASLTTGLMLRPALPPLKLGPQASLNVGPGSVSLTGQF